MLNTIPLTTAKVLWLFAALQLLDFATTITAFSLGGVEKNALVSWTLPLLGPVTGVLVCKLLLIGVAAGAVMIGRRRAVLLANFAYAGVIVWNLHVVIRLIGR